MQREIRFFISWNFHPSLAQKSPVGTSSLIPFGTNSDTPWDWRLPKILLGYSSFLYHVGVYYASYFLGNYINHQNDKISYITLDPVDEYVYIADLILDSVLAEKIYLTKCLN